YPVPNGETEMSFLRHITEAGARERYRPYHDKARQQIARELALIEKLDLAGYFLIVWDIVNYCRQQDILVQGRGSAANSAVCYSLGITAVDPIAMDLLFERFLSEERGEWPDIDLDLPSGDRRERVIQWDKDDCADMGIVKVDLLGLGMMAALQDAIELVKWGRRSFKEDTPGVNGESVGVSSLNDLRPHFDLAHIPMDDAKVYDMLQKAETIGVFQVESRAQMATLPRLKPTHFYD